MNPFGRLVSRPDNFLAEKAQPNPLLEKIQKLVYENEARNIKAAQLKSAVEALGNQECTGVHLSVGIAVYFGTMNRDEVLAKARQEYGSQMDQAGLEELADAVLEQGAQHGQSYQLHDIHLPPHKAIDLLALLEPHLEKPDLQAAAQALRDLADSLTAGETD